MTRRSLFERERFVFIMRMSGARMYEIAECLGLSTGRVAQIAKTADLQVELAARAFEHRMHRLTSEPWDHRRLPLDPDEETGEFEFEKIDVPRFSLPRSRRTEWVPMPRVKLP